MSKKHRSRRAAVRSGRRRPRLDPTADPTNASIRSLTDPLSEPSRPVPLQLLPPPGDPGALGDDETDEFDFGMSDPFDEYGAGEDDLEFDGYLDLGPGTAGANVIVGLIATGRLDDHLGQIQAAIARRHGDRLRAASNRAAAELTIGDRVRIRRGIRPLYLVGAHGTVVGWANRNAVVQLDHAVGRFSSGTLRCPPLALERVSGRGPPAG